MSDLPRGFVPLPKIGEHTDRVSFDNLGFPVGFNEDHIGVNLRRMERFATCASIGAIQILGFNGQASDFSITPVGNNFGVATAAARANVTEQRLSTGMVNGSELHPTATVKINTSEVAEQIRQDGRFRRGQFDPAAQAKYLDRGLKDGLGNAAESHLTKWSDLLYPAVMYPLLGTINASIDHSGPLKNASTLASVGLITSIQRRTFPFSRGAPRRPFTLVIGSSLAIDRLALSHAALHTGRMIKPI